MRVLSVWSTISRTEKVAAVQHWPSNYDPSWGLLPISEDIIKVASSWAKMGCSATLRSSIVRKNTTRTRMRYRASHPPRWFRLMSTAACRGVYQNDKAASRNTRRCCGGSRAGASNHEWLYWNGTVHITSWYAWVAEEWRRPATCNLVS